MEIDSSNTTNSSGTTGPVLMSNRCHAKASCNKLGLAEGLTPVYAANGMNFCALTYASISATSNVDWEAATAILTSGGYRLPTEMEWMWAAMGAHDDGQGGGTDTTGYAKAFAASTGSNAIGDNEWYCTNRSNKANPAGTEADNELGFYDINGNVCEWCWDWYGSYPTGTQTDCRGGRFGHDPRQSRWQLEQ
jgi:hypothetical protein